MTLDEMLLAELAKPATCGECEMAASIVAANEAAQPQWTTEPPTEPGWYWGVPQRADCKPEMMEVIDDDGQLMVAGNIYDVPLSDHVGWLWLRIEAPEVPK